MCSLSDFFNAAKQHPPHPPPPLQPGGEKDGRKCAWTHQPRRFWVNCERCIWKQAALHSGYWNCLYGGSACCDNSAPMILLYSNSCQIDRRRPCSALLADAADESHRVFFFLFLGEGGGGWRRNGNRRKHGNINKLQPLGLHHPPLSPLLCICLHLRWTFVISPLICYYYLVSSPLWPPLLPGSGMLVFAKSASVALERARPSVHLHPAWGRALYFISVLKDDGFTAKCNLRHKVQDLNRPFPFVFL